MNENLCFFSTATRSGFPGPTKCSCPTTSSSFCGRMRAASGSITPWYSSVKVCVRTVDRYALNASKLFMVLIYRYVHVQRNGVTLNMFDVSYMHNCTFHLWHQASGHSSSNLLLRSLMYFLVIS